MGDQASDLWWGLYNHDNLLAVGRTRAECIRHCEAFCDYKKAKRKGYMEVRRVVVSPPSEVA